MGGKGVVTIRYEVDEVEAFESVSLGANGPIVVDGKSKPPSREVSIRVVCRRALFSSFVDGGIVVVFIVGPNMSIRISLVPFGRVCIINTCWVLISPGLVESGVEASSSIMLTVVGSVGSI